MTKQIKREAKKVLEYIQGSNVVYAFGNGGSSSIAEHMACDWMKGSGGKVKVISLSSNGALLSAIANDLGYEHTCSAQLNFLEAGTDDVLVLISSSGSSPNIRRAGKIAQDLGMTVIGFVGFNGGSVEQFCDEVVHIKSTDYGIIEDYHSQVMHEVARQLRGK